MSFIVEATRRQQQETVPMEAANLAFDRVRRREQRIWWVVGVLTATGVILTAAIIIKWFVLSPQEPIHASTGSKEEVAIVSSVKDVGSDTSWYQPVETIEPQPLENTNFGTPEAPGRATDIDQTITPVETKPPRETRTPIALRVAPDNVQQALLGFNYSSHLYTSIPEKRSLSVDGKRMREGEVIGEWVLAEITQDGAIWDNGEIMVDVPVLDLWQ